MKFYITKDGCMGYVNGVYILFPTEDEYVEFIREEPEDDD